jgi:DNA-binding SARP family transcriptional activator
VPVDLRLLGPLEVVDEDGAPVDLGGARQRAVLAALLIRRGEVVSNDYLVDAVWGDAAPRTAVTSLQIAIHRLRKALGTESVLTRPPGYVLALPAEQTDVGRFESLVDGARALPADERAAALRAALDLWRGPPLEEPAFERFATAEAHRLEELRLSALESWFDAELEAGRAAEHVAALDAAVREHPLRERFHAQLMQALYEAGRQADALEAFQAARRLLAEELGIDPSPQLHALQQRILRQEVARPRVAIADQDEHFAEVADVLLGARLVPVLGAADTPLVDRLATRFRYPDDGARDLTRVAQFAALTKGAGPLYDELRSMLGAAVRPGKVHMFFAALPKVLRERGLPHQLLVTTSYDLALEQALLAAGEEFDVVTYLASGRDRGRFCHIASDGGWHVIDEPNTYATELSLERRTVILKLHGGIDPLGARERDTFVVTEDDYIDYLGRGDVGEHVPVVLAATLRTSHYLFLGYGMRNWNLRLVLRRMWGEAAVGYRSWAVLPEPQPLEREFWRARDVDLLDLPLDDYVAGLGRYVGLTDEVPA